MDTISDQTSLLLSNARVVLRDHVADTATILVQDGRIASIDSGRSEIRAHSTIDLQRATLFPGFIDVHIHGAAGIDVMRATADDLHRASEFLATQGVIAWLPTLVPARLEEYQSAVGAIDELMRTQNRAGGRVAARLLGVHYEGPFVNASQCGALHAEHFKTFSGASELDSLPIPTSANARRMITVAPEVEGGVELVAELTRRRWIVSIGHTRADVGVLDRAHAAGARHMTHFMNAMAPLHHRSPGPVGWGLSRDDVTCDFIADGVHLDKLVLGLLMKLKGSKRLALISDAIAAAGKGDGAYEIWGETITVKNGRTRNAHGNIAGSVITMLDAALMMRSLGASEVDVAWMAATNPAGLLGGADECGSIDEGKRADLVALDSEGRVVLTLVGGRVAFQGE